MNTDFLKSKGPSAIGRILGVSRQTAAQYIKGANVMSVDQAMKLAQHYGVSLTYIVDPDYRASQDDQIAALTKANKKLTEAIKAAKPILESVDTVLTNLTDCLAD